MCCGNRTFAWLLEQLGDIENQEGSLKMQYSRGQYSVPAFLLKKLYVKGSLQNSETGFEFSLKNVWSPGSIVAVSSVAVNGQKTSLERVTVVWNGSRMKASEISADDPVYINLNQEVTFRVRGEQLAAGSHKISLTIVTKQAGGLEIPISDVI